LGALRGGKRNPCRPIGAKKIPTPGSLRARMGAKVYQAQKEHDIEAKRKVNSESPWAAERAGLGRKRANAEDDQRKEESAYGNQRAGREGVIPERQDQVVEPSDPRDVRGGTDCAGGKNAWWRGSEPGYRNSTAENAGLRRKKD